MSMKNSNDTIGNRTRDLPTCSAVPQPTAPPRTVTWRKIFAAKMDTVIPTLEGMELLLSRAPVYRHLMKQLTTDCRVLVFRRVIHLSMCFHGSL